MDCVSISTATLFSVIKKHRDSTAVDSDSTELFIIVPSCNSKNPKNEFGNIPTYACVPPCSRLSKVRSTYPGIYKMNLSYLYIGCGCGVLWLEQFRCSYSVCCTACFVRFFGAFKDSGDWLVKVDQVTCRRKG